jgi:hypothetical protein
VKRHLIIPDTQVAPGVPLAHMRWIGAAIERYKPDVVVHLGDHWDMASCSTHSEIGSKDKENQRIQADIDAGNEALELLEAHMGSFVPKRKVILRGNHEHRLSRFINSNPRVEGAIGFHLFNDRELGWEVVDYFNGSPKAIKIDGVLYAHYFTNPNTGKPIGGTIANRLAKIGGSFVQGHSQGLLRGNVPMAVGGEHYGVVAGSAYLHDESYKGMANDHWRGIVVLNEVRDGRFCEMPLSLDYLCSENEGMSLARYMQRTYKRAKERFTVATDVN